MIFSVTLSKPVKNISEILGDDFTRVKIKIIPSGRSDSGGNFYFAEFFTQKQVFHRKMSEGELSDFLSAHEGTSFKSCVERTDSGEIQVLANKKGKITRIAKPAKQEQKSSGENPLSQGEPSAQKKSSAVERLLHAPKSFGADGQNRKKNYILKEGTPVPFLVLLGVMTAEGKVISGKYDKFQADEPLP